jgi:hypothetical protein
MEASFHPHTWSVARLLGSSPVQTLVASAKAAITFDWTKALRLLQLEYPPTQSLVDAHRAAFELVRYLLLAVHEKGSAKLEPSAVVDVALRSVMIEPRTYHGLCVAMKGDIIDYEPLYRLDSPMERFARQKHTLDLYIVVFGDEPPNEFWGKVSSEPLTAAVGTVAPEQGKINLFEPSCGCRMTSRASGFLYAIQLRTLLKLLMSALQNDLETSCRQCHKRSCLLSFLNRRVSAGTTHGRIL